MVWQVFPKRSERRTRKQGCNYTWFILCAPVIRYVLMTDAKAVAAELKKTYTAPTVATAEKQLNNFGENLHGDLCDQRDPVVG